MMGEYPALSPEDIETIAAQARRNRPRPVTIEVVSGEYQDSILAKNHP